MARCASVGTRLLCGKLGSPNPSAWQLLEGGGREANETGAKRPREGLKGTGLRCEGHVAVIGKALRVEPASLGELGAHKAAGGAPSDGRRLCRQGDGGGPRRRHAGALGSPHSSGNHRPIEAGVADNTSAACFVVSEARLPLDTDLGAIPVTLQVDNEEGERATGAAVRGSPLGALAVLANFLGERGQGFSPGEIGLTGGLTNAVPLEQGHVVRPALALERSRLVLAVEPGQIVHSSV